MMLVSTWLDGIGLHYAVDSFAKASVQTPEALCRLDVTDFDGLGVHKTQDRKKLFLLVQRIRMAVDEKNSKALRTKELSKDSKILRPPQSESGGGVLRREAWGEISPVVDDHYLPDPSIVPPLMELGTSRCSIASRGIGKIVMKESTPRFPSKKVARAALKPKRSLIAARSAAAEFADDSSVGQRARKAATPRFVSKSPSSSIESESADGESVVDVRARRKEATPKFASPVNDMSSSAPAPPSRATARCAKLRDVTNSLQVRSSLEGKKEAVHPQQSAQRHRKQTQQEAALGEITRAYKQALNSMQQVIDGSVTLVKNAEAARATAPRVSNGMTSYVDDAEKFVDKEIAIVGVLQSKMAAFMEARAKHRDSSSFVVKPV